MGFKRSTLKIEFDGEFEGLVIRARRLSIGDVLRLLQDDELMRKGVMDAFDDVCALLDKKITYWNLEEDVLDPETGEPTGQTQPIPKSAKTIAELDEVFIAAIIQGLRAGSAGVSGPLETPSSGGDPALEASIPMDVSSPSP